MKKAVSIFMILALLFSLAACTSNAEDEESSSLIQQSSLPSSTPTEEPNSQNDSFKPTKIDSKSLVIYFSWSGNTKNVAESIQAQTDSDIFEIIPATPYSDDYNTVLEVAQEEQQKDVRPAIANNTLNIAPYDVIYVGFPNWWGDMPMILYTFFDTYDLSGKTIAPFCTSGGSGLSNTVSEIKNLEQNATVTDGLHIGSDSSSNPDNAVNEWLNEIGAVKQEIILWKNDFLVFITFPRSSFSACNQAKNSNKSYDELMTVDSPEATDMENF